MSKTMKRSTSKNRAVLALGVMSAGTVGQLTVTQAHANVDASQRIGAGQFDLTKQASEATFPVMFDRPSGVNAAALAGTVINLGTNSEIYKSAVKVVPELANGGTMSRLLSDAMSENATTKANARAIIVKLINWYNGLGGTKITTQSGAAYTAANLDEPISVLAVAFSNDSSINAEVSRTIDTEFKNVRTVQDVMSIFEKYKSGVSADYKAKFDAYANKVYADGADITALSQYSEVKPVLDAYENMYAEGAAAIRRQLLEGRATSTEAGVTFFESAIITGRVGTNDSGSSTSTTPEQSKVTRWVNEKGEQLTPSETGKDFGSQKTFDGYTFTRVEENGNTRTYVYTPNKQVTSDTVWVDESGKVLKEKVTGEFPDTDGNDIPGHVLVSTKTTKDSDGNTHVVNTYRKVTEDTIWVDESGKVLKEKVEGTFPDNDGTSDIPTHDLIKVTQNTDEQGNKHTINTYRVKENKNVPDTYWFDSEGNQLKEPALDQTLPDNDGTSDIPGYRVVRVYTITKEDITTGPFKESSFGEGDTLNIYDKAPAEEKITTKWVDESGKELKPSEEGAKPDKEGDDIPTHELVRITTDEKGNVTNVYKERTPGKPTTKWVDESGKSLKPEKEGTFPDKEGDDVPGYTIVRTTTDEKGNVVNVYKVKPMTKWVDESGKELKPSEEGTKPDKDGNDIPGYIITKINQDKDGNVVNIYKPLTVVSKVTTQWVDESGKPLQDPKEGSFPDTEGDDIQGYTLVHTKKDEAGNVINVYRVNAKQVTTYWVDKEGNLLTPEEVGQEFGKEKTFDGYKLVDVKVSADGTKKFYIYEPQAKPVEKELPKTGSASTLATTLAGLGSVLAGVKLGKRRKK